MYFLLPDTAIAVAAAGPNFLCFLAAGQVSCVFPPPGTAIAVAAINPPNISHPLPHPSLPPASPPAGAQGTGEPKSKQSRKNLPWHDKQRGKRREGRQERKRKAGEECYTDEEIDAAGFLPEE